MRHVLLPAALALLVVPTTTAAQVRPGSRDTVPTAMLPPAGKCRVWITGVAPAQQPAATDCPTALRQRSANSVILYGPPLKSAGSGRFDPAVGRESKAEVDERATVRVESERARDTERPRETTQPAVKPLPVGAPALRAEKPAAKPTAKRAPVDPAKKKPELP